MIRILALLAVAACTTTDSPTGEIVAASVVVDGTALAVAIDATLTGPYVDGDPVWTSQYSDVLQDGTTFDTLSLTAGDQVWHSAAVLHFADTRTTAPDAVIARCGKVVRLVVALGVGAGPPSTSAVSNVAIDCR